MSSNMQRFRNKLAAGQLCLGPGISFSDPAVTEALCDSVDFLWIDLEHNPISLESLLGHLIAARAGGAPALVRVPGSEVSFLKRVLDTGAEGIIVPQVRSAEEVRSVVAACRYPPVGTRGYGPRRGSNYGRDGGKEYLQRANADMFVSVQIEHVDALNALDNILAVPGLDSVVIGPNDLSGSMGIMGEVKRPEVVEAITTIISKARRAGVYAGIGMGPIEDSVCQAAQWGAHWVQCGGDYSYMISFADQLYSRVRKRLGSTQHGRKSGNHQ